jgi:hypothetical protein
MTEGSYLKALWLSEPSEHLGDLWSGGLHGDQNPQASPHISSHRVDVQRDGPQGRGGASEGGGGASEGGGEELGGSSCWSCD